MLVGPGRGARGCPREPRLCSPCPLPADLTRAFPGDSELLGNPETATGALFLHLHLGFGFGILWLPGYAFSLVSKSPVDRSTGIQPGECQPFKSPAWSRLGLEKRAQLLTK